MTDSSPAARRVLFYSHDGTGLGHLRITLGVATAYASLRPQDSLLLLTGSLHAGAFPLPENLDFVKIPAMPKRGIYASLPPTEGYTGSHNSTIRFRTALALATVQGFDPHLVVIDHAPAGLFRELAPAIAWLRRHEPGPCLALLMRDITFGPEQTRSIWTNEGVYPLLDEAYDRILVYGDRRVFDPIAAYGVSEPAASRTRFCGYLAPSPPRRSPAQVRGEVGAGTLPLVAVSVGGGVVGFDPDFAAVVRAADAVVCMGGYNSIVESVYFGKRPIVMPRVPGSEEQVLRAEGFARLGLATVIGPNPLDASALWDAIDRELNRVGHPGPILAFDGLECIA